MKQQAMVLRHLVRWATFVIISSLIVSCGSSPPDDILAGSGQSAIVFVHEPSQNDPGRNAMESNANEFFPGTDLMLLSPISPQGVLTNLTAQYTQEGQSDLRRYGAAVDPEVSYDGKKILFSMRKNSAQRWRIYEMNADGTSLNQLTNQAEGDDMDPTYLPNGQIMFTSTRSGIVDEYERRDSPLLHVADRGPDGKLINVRQISFNQSHDTNPMVHSSGKVIYSRWEHLGNPNKFPLFVINPDGTRPFVMYGNHSPSQSGSRVFLEPRELSDGGIVCSVMERNSPFEGGAIAIIDISKSDDNLVFISPPDVPFNNTNQSTQALYKTPHPIIDKTASLDRQEKILVAMSPIPILAGMSGSQEQADYGIYVMDKDGGNMRLIYDDPQYNDYDPVPVQPRSEVPGGIPNVIPMDPYVAAAIQSGKTTGMFFDGNVYDRATTDGQTRPDKTRINADGTIGQARYLRVLEAVPLPRSGNQRGGPIGDTNFEKQKVIGYAPIRPDGSFSVEVPANRSLHMQTLDENGMMLVNQLTWVQVMPGERRLCTGCHDSHDRDKVINDLQVTASAQVSNKSGGFTYDSGFDNAVDVMASAAARPDTVDFFDRSNTGRSNTIQAVFERNCASCHGSANAGGPAGGLTLENQSTDMTPATDQTTTVYDRLTQNGGYRTATNQTMDYVTQNGARQSPLLWVLYNKQLNRTDNRDLRPLAYDHTQVWTKDQYGRLDPFLPQNKDLLTLIEWVDEGVQFSNSVSH
jgi:Hydrazine synthase alpha subunit middle domain/Cytochrome c/WD40-like Beta Propeller Repeat